MSNFAGKELKILSYSEVPCLSQEFKIPTLKIILELEGYGKYPLSVKNFSTVSFQFNSTNPEDWIGKKIVLKSINIGNSRVMMVELCKSQTENLL